MSFEDAIFREHLLDRPIGDVEKTNVHLPQWTRIAVALLHNEHKMSESKIYTGLINHGTAMLQHRFGKDVELYGDAQNRMLRSKNIYIRTFAIDFRIDVDGLAEGGKRRTVHVPTWCVNFLGSFGKSVRMNYASLIRLAIYTSLNKCATLDSEHKTICKTEVESFERKFNDYIDFCDKLAE